VTARVRSLSAAAPVIVEILDLAHGPVEADAYSASQLERLGSILELVSEETGADRVKPREQLRQTVGAAVGPSVDVPSFNATAGGIFDGGFETYRTLTQEDYRSLLTSGLIVLDTNALLNLYRYHAKTRKDLIEILTQIKNRLWIPHQAMNEFWQGRSSVIGSHSREIEGIIDGLFRSRSDLERGIRTWANRVGLPPEESAEIVSTIESAVGDVTDKIREMSADDAFEHAEDTAKDPVITALSSILQGSVGDPLTADELRKVKREAVQRIADKRPPGWKDANKRDNPEGDYIIWFQTLQEAKRRAVDVLFVTGDIKDDWWRREQGEVRGPLPELVYEMRIVADVRLFMLRPASLLIHAGDALGLRISKESVQDAQRVSSGRDLASTDDIRGNLLNLTAELLTTQQELYLNDSNPDIIRALRRASMELYDVLRDPSTRDPVEAVWPVISKGIEIGLLGGAQKSQSKSRLRMQAMKLRLVLEELYTTAIRAWLNSIADQYIDQIIRSPHAFSYAGPLPPMVTSVEGGLAASMGNRQRLDFVASITDGHEVTISRIIMRSGEL
jgi:hypothetical protein